MLRYNPTIESDSVEFRAQLPQIEIRPSDLDFIESPFHPSRCRSLDIVLPPKGTAHGLEFDLCLSSRVPILVAVHPLSPLRSYIPSKYSTKHYVNSINNIEPITAKGADELVRHLQLRKQSNTVSLVLHPIDKTSVSTYESSCAHHDSITILRHNHIAACKDKPEVPKSIYAALDGSDSHIWHEALYHQYDKNAAIQLYAAPIPAEDVPNGLKVFRSMLACSIKEHREEHFKFTS